MPENECQQRQFPQDSSAEIIAGLHGGAQKFCIFEASSDGLVKREVTLEVKKVIGRNNHSFVDELINAPLENVVPGAFRGWRDEQVQVSAR